MDFFRFFLVTEPATSHVVGFATQLAHAFSAGAPAYGRGVKTISVALLLRASDGSIGRRRQKPKYLAGVREIKAHGLTARVEDALEFSVCPSFDAVVHATSERGLAAALLPAVKEVATSVLRLKVPEFDSRKFLADLESFLATAAQKGAYMH